MAEKKFDVTALGELLIDFTENGLKQGVPLAAEAVFSEINEKFPQRNNIRPFCSMGYGSMSGPSNTKSYFSTSISTEPPASKVMASADWRV